MKKWFLLILIMILLSPRVVGQVILGARPIGMGGAFTGLADDANAIFANPAGIGQLRGQWASFSTKSIKGEKHATFNGIAHTDFGTFGAGINIADFPIGYTASVEGDRIVKIFKNIVVLSYSRELNEFAIIPESLGKLSIGASVKATFNKVETAGGLTNDLEPTYSTDFGVIFTPNDAISLGACFKNLANVWGEDSGSGVNKAESEPRAAVGVSGKLLKNTVTWCLEEGKIGVEWQVHPSVALRVGQMGRNKTWGCGFSTENFCVDYAYENQADPVHHVTVSVAVDRAGIF